MIQAHSLTLWQAWHLWRVSEVPADATLWGLRILWWARLGKILEFIAGLSIVADILGPARLAAFGKSLHGAITRKTLGGFLRNAFRWYGAMLRYTFLTRKGSPEELAARFETERYGADTINLVVTFAVTGWVTWMVWGDVTFLAGFALGFMVLGVTLVFVGPVITCGIIVAGTFLGFILDLFVIEPAAGLLARPSADRGVKVFALVCFVIGFHFDLLAS